jgi:hypothetical protein
VTKQFLDVGNQCGVCRKYGKFVAGHSVQSSIAARWAQNIARIRSPKVELCTGCA